MDTPPREILSVTDHLGDRTLAAAAAMGERAAFETIVHRYGPLLYGYVRRMISDRDGVDDVVQETFIAAWRQIDNYRGESALKTWLFRICDRKIIDSRRVRYAEPIDDRLIDPIDPSADSNPAVVLSNTEFLAALERALAELPVRQRAVWVLREIDGLTFPQIGVTLKLSPGAARGHHHRAQSTLRLRMQRWQQ
ncbi:ECF RNA polymerase sigma-E factor [Mycolicibacterium chlorophenolicum]|uniref:RNA polymerase sigma factor n=1 Tax=Mycolicibacterium chlorophenolicum TaxID=37916 RepID=A0A0J6WIK7_9MYCO|nr:ECF RNA polymerase sigma-E factor [Mycolicibacterium chlorophenolicum]